MSTSPHRNIILIIAAFMLALGISVLLFKQGNGSSVQPGDEVDIPQSVTVSGTAVCLPHKDTDGPQTLECAFGFKLDDGTHIALDLSALQQDGFFDLPMNERLTLEGTLVPIEQISASHWDIYDITGIMRVEAVL